MILCSGIHDLDKTKLENCVGRKFMRMLVYTTESDRKGMANSGGGSVTVYSSEIKLNKVGPQYIALSMYYFRLQSLVCAILLMHSKTPPKSSKTAWSLPIKVVKLNIK